MYGKKTNSTESKSKGTGGFTLIEVLMAMAVFSVGFLALASMQITATNGNTNARNLMDAVSFLEDHMEYLKNIPYSQDFINDHGMHPDLDPAGNPHQRTLTDVAAANTYTGIREHFEGTLVWNVYDGVTDTDDDGTPDATYPPNSLKIVVQLQWRTAMKSRSLDYTFVRVRDIM